ncbi:g-patch domain containing protein [Grosmannia clavigera kw1407]|uniref:G-patch domain containing protein n=1 Tax=Grosmannia clavigera (strain kw1407 / UAMH 11150) TaxID=655863 RepID=F0XMY4_GROCL|nr:g-patch domain containing protein [Grosmannia clavigera kw1407]EFX00954.1 g-patch domain containing protein [Grosmannia clavigera kw1407]
MADDDVDDYMTMTFDDEASGGGGGGRSSSSGRKKPETSLQRRARLQREGRERGRVLSKAEQARAAEQEREAALSRSLLETAATRPSAAASKGLAMMARMGFKPGEALGRRREEGAIQTDAQPSAQTEPIRIQVKRDRAGIGAREAEEEDSPSTKRPKTEPLADIDPLAYRDRIRLERETQRLDRLVHAAQVVAEAMDEQLAEATGRVPPKDRPLADVDVLWRGLVRDRRRADSDRIERQRQRQRLDQSLRGSGGGGGDDDDDDQDEDEDDRLAEGRTASLTSLLGSGRLRRTVHDEADGSESESEDGNQKAEEDTELATFEALSPGERLQRIVDWLRTRRRYCFWCKHTYPDDSMEGCPGETEEQHE